MLAGKMLLPKGFNPQPKVFAPVRKKPPRPPELSATSVDGRMSQTKPSVTSVPQTSKHSTARRGSLELPSNRRQPTRNFIVPKPKPQPTTTKHPELEPRLRRELLSELLRQPRPSDCVRDAMVALACLLAGIHPNIPLEKINSLLTAKWSEIRAVLGDIGTICAITHDYRDLIKPGRLSGTALRAVADALREYEWTLKREISTDCALTEEIVNFVRLVMKKAQEKRNGAAEYKAKVEKAAVHVSIDRIAPSDLDESLTVDSTRGRLLAERQSIALLKWKYDRRRRELSKSIDVSYAEGPNSARESSRPAPSVCSSLVIDWESGECIKQRLTSLAAESLDWGQERCRGGLKL
eukprot:TRINITY_DN9971_c0_g3_i2.p1 TRINITY_DN9971_c0_g3~~TRINITY_DN9971_c0_g3_i2.p1  ORF type:complete len:351 (+),score=32.44 TRINITY_DN9971_c0_g3_i2:133-1185(+)